MLFIGLGEYKGTDENGKMMFELEANNLTDENGVSKQTKAKYFTEGYVESDFEAPPPGFWANLASGGKLQASWDAEQQQKKKKSLDVSRQTKKGK
jgi:protein-L-isoaspartate O-methyltransferase